jgi:8-oxo-dGTP pyrophosphatase MutT (NUDIX family)
VTVSRQTLIDQLRAHQPASEGERQMLARMIAFAESHEDCCSRSLLIGHMTGSAWVVDHSRSLALLTHHRKLNKWLQLGGHADGNPDLLAVARREVEEESGLTEITPLSEGPFDIDVHSIPARGSEPEHFHFDVRFLFAVNSNHPLTVSDESHSLAWIPLADLADPADPKGLRVGESILRMVRKTPAIR